MLTFHDNQIPAIVVNPTHTGHGILVLPNLDRQDYVILNSTANVQKAIDALGQYERIHCLLDNDGAGIRATQAITAEYSYRLRDFSHNYREYSDLNDYLCGRKQEQKNGQKLLLRQKKGMGI